MGDRSIFIRLKFPIYIRYLVSQAYTIYIRIWNITSKL